MSGKNVTDTYTLKIVDQILAPLKRIDAQAAKVNENLERMEKLASSGLGMLKLAGGIGAAVAGLATLKGALGVVLDLLQKGAEAATWFGKSVLDAAMFRERHLTMLRHQLGERAGSATYNKVLELSQLTPGTAADLMEGASRLLNIGVRGQGFSGALAARADVQAMFGNEKADMFVRGLSDMFSKSKLEEQDFKQALAGVLPANVFQQAVLRLKGITVAADKAGAKFEALKKAGKITGKEGFFGALAAMEQHVDKGKGLGWFAVERGKNSLEGMISNATEAWDNFLRKMDWDKMPGIKALKAFLQRLAPYFDHATPQGQRLAAVIERMTNALFGGLDRISSKDLDRFFEGGVRVAERLVAVIERAWEWLDKLQHGSWADVIGQSARMIRDVGKLLGEGIWQGFKAAAWGGTERGGPSAKAAPMIYGIDRGAGGRALGAILPSLGKAGRGLWEAGGKVGHGLWDAGGKVGSGLLAAGGDIGGALGKVGRGLGEGFGILDKPQRQGMEAAGADLAAGAEEGLRRRAESHSPSEAMARAGEDLVDGLLVGIRRRLKGMELGGGRGDQILDELVEALRGAAHRTGARVI